MVMNDTLEEHDWAVLELLNQGKLFSYAKKQNIRGLVPHNTPGGSSDLIM